LFTPWISFGVKEVRQRTREYSLCVVVGKTFRLPVPRIFPCLRAVNFAPWLPTLFLENPSNVTLGTFWGDFVTADPEVLRIMRPRNTRVFCHYATSAEAAGFLVSPSCAACSGSSSSTSRQNSCHFVTNSLSSNRPR